MSATTATASTALLLHASASAAAPATSVYSSPSRVSSLAGAHAELLAECTCILEGAELGRGEANAEGCRHEVLHLHAIDELRVVQVSRGSPEQTLKRRPHLSPRLALVVPLLPVPHCVRAVLGRQVEDVSDMLVEFSLSLCLRCFSSACVYFGMDLRLLGFLRHPPRDSSDPLLQSKLKGDCASDEHAQRVR
eukprot:1515458-Rhodomonas_salina.1